MEPLNGSTTKKVTVLFNKKMAETMFSYTLDKLIITDRDVFHFKMDNR